MGWKGSEGEGSGREEEKEEEDGTSPFPPSSRGASFPWVKGRRGGKKVGASGSGFEFGSEGRL